MRGGGAKATVMTCWYPFVSFRFFVFFLLPYFPPRRPHYAILCLMAVSFSSLLPVVFVGETAVIFLVLFCPCSSSFLLRAVLSVKQVRMYLFLFSPYGVPLVIAAFLSFPVLSHHFFRSPVVCFALFSFMFSFQFLFSFFYRFFFMVWRLACFVVFSYPVR